MSQRPHNADHPVPAHPDRAHVVKEQNGEGACWVARWQNERAHEHVGPAGLVHHGAAKVIMLAPESSQPVGRRSAAKLGCAVDHDASRLSGRMRIDDVNDLRHGVVI